MNQFRKEAIWYNKQTFSCTVGGAHTGPDIGEQVGNIIKRFNVHSARLSKPVPTHLSYWEKWKSVQDISISDIPSSTLLPRTDEKQYKCLAIMVYWINYFISSHSGILCCYLKR